MGRHAVHEEHVNHEAWAIPYGDLITLLLAFFVVMYAISSVNAGKYRVLADSLSAAFGGQPRSVTPIQLGQTQLRGASFDHPSLMTAAARRGPSEATPIEIKLPLRRPDAPHVMAPSQAQGKGMAGDTPGQGRAGEAGDAEGGVGGTQARQLQALGTRIQDALQALVAKGMVKLRQGPGYMEVEIQSDILFASGAAEPSPVALATVRQLAGVLRDVPNAVRVEGYTDDQPIRTALFRSNWELSAARAASVVHELVGRGIAPGRLAMVGYGEHQPVADNATAKGRNDNRRVDLVILAMPAGADAVHLPEIARAQAPATTLQAAAAPAPPRAAAASQLQLAKGGP